MALEATFGEFIRSLEQWREAMENLQLTVREDCPEEMAFADSLNDAISDQLGWLEEALESARTAAAAAAGDGDLPKAQAQLASAQRLVNQSMLHQAEHLTGYEQMRLLKQLEGRGQTRLWRDWVRTVTASFSSFPRLVHAVLEKGRECWPALAERQRRETVNVRNVAVGQQFFRESGSELEEGVAGASFSKLWATEPQPNH